MSIYAALFFFFELANLELERKDSSRDSVSACRALTPNRNVVSQQTWLRDDLTLNNEIHLGKVLILQGQKEVLASSWVHLKHKNKCEMSLLHVKIKNFFLAINDYIWLLGWNGLLKVFSYQVPFSVAFLECLYS